MFKFSAPNPLVFLIPTSLCPAFPRLAFRLRRCRRPILGCGRHRLSFRPPVPRLRAPRRPTVCHPPPRRLVLHLRGPCRPAVHHPTPRRPVPHHFTVTGLRRRQARQGLVPQGALRSMRPRQSGRRNLYPGLSCWPVLLGY